MRYFTREQLKIARRADLYEFIQRYHMGTHVREGQSLHPYDNHSLSIKKGYSGYKDFATDETGNSLDYAVKYLGYNIDEAVLLLSGGVCTQLERPQRGGALPEKKTGDPVFPKAYKGQYRHLFAYLKSRGIPVGVIQALIDGGLMYQSEENHNIVFISYERDWAEQRGTYTYAEKAFHGVVKNSRKDGFWWFRTSQNADVAYLCEGAIDAISLYLIHKQENRSEGAYYISIGGVSKQPAIDRVKSQIHTVLAVDNDMAGEECRKRNPELEFIIPHKKDWNDDLRSLL